MPGHTGKSPLVPEQTLRSAKRILYMTHLAIGDFTYQRVLLKKLKHTYPNLAIDIWIDDCRDKPKAWHQGRNMTLVQWLKSEPFLDNVYPIARSNAERAEMIKTARQQHYDVVFFVAQQRSERYAKIARDIAPQGTVVGSRAISRLHPKAWLAFGKLDGYFPLSPKQEANLHISEVFATRFEQCLAMRISDEEFASGFELDVPATFLSEASHWLATRFGSVPGKLVLINPVSTNEKRDYHIAQVAQLIELMHERDGHLRFVINLPPASIEGYLTELQKLADLSDIQLDVFCAQQHFYQLPAMLARCDVIITVETAIMHLCAALKKPQIVLMREQARQWQPYEACKVLYGNKRVDSIDVLSVVDSFSALYPS